MKILKTWVLIFCVTLFANLNAQPPGPEGMKNKREQIESMRIGFITKKLNLTPEDSQKFWPVYNQYTGEVDDIRIQHHKDVKKMKQNLDELSDGDITILVDGELAFRQNELDIRKKYHQQFKEVISIKQVAQLYRAEEDFKRELLKMIRNKQRDGGRQQKK
jgi:hypothetical protein